jgi:hypothetical protein
MNRRELMKLGTAAASGLLLHESATAQDAHARAKVPSFDGSAKATINYFSSCSML